jgi:cytidine deaminase
MPQKISLITEILSFDSENDLPDDDRALLKLAFEAAKRAYAPYSNFNVGAALLLENGEIVTGNNQENAAYPSGLCAERVAVFYAHSRFPHLKIMSIAICARAVNKIIEEPVAPCGACRQSILEFEISSGSPIRIIMGSETGKVYVSHSMTNLLPMNFNSDSL